MKLLSLKESDERKLYEGISQLKALHQKLVNQYSLKSELVELTDRRFALRGILEDELDIIRQHQKDLINKSNELSQLKAKLEESLITIQEISDITAEDEDGESLYSRILEITNEENLTNLENYTQEISQTYSALFIAQEDNSSKIQQIIQKIEEISKNYEELFVEVNEEDETKFEEINNKIFELNQYYKNFFESSEPDKPSKKAQIDSQLKKLQTFYDKIYGNEEREIPSLSNDLEIRLANLKNVEDRAKSVIGLSSEAGLAGGFVIKGKEAKTGQLVSLIVFVTVVLAIFGFNFYLFDKQDFLNMKWDTFLFKLLINAPLIWIATIANINLNRFSRLEQEYSHKEALAKSYERYKTEIDELEKLGIEGSEELKLKLLEINLEAFKVNPAEHSDKAKSDFSIFDLVKQKKEDKNDKGDKSSET